MKKAMEKLLCFTLVIVPLTQAGDLLKEETIARRRLISSGPSRQSDVLGKAWGGWFLQPN